MSLSGAERPSDDRSAYRIHAAVVVLGWASFPVGATLAILNGISACDAHRWNCGFPPVGLPTLLLGPPALTIAAAILAAPGRKMSASFWATLVAVGPLWGYVAAIALTY
jgi:hypothetical protein